MVFVTPAELRGSGGFIGSYAELSVADVTVDLVRSGSVKDLLTVPAGDIELTGLED